MTGDGGRDSDPEAPPAGSDGGRARQLGRLEGIQQHLQLLEQTGITFLQLPNVFDVDPYAEEPYVLSNSFIPERIGGSVRIVHRDDEDGTREPLGNENLNQMLGSFLPGGFRKRWQNFDLWKGSWEVVHDEPGSAAIGPMFAFDERLPLADLLGTDAGKYTPLDVDPEDVIVVVPNTLYVEQLPRDANYYWSVDYGTVFAAREPFGRALPLGRSDPTTNYLWFRHRRDERTTEPTELPDPNEVLVSYAFEDDVEFLRCYYTSLLTLYEKEDNRTLSRTIDYVDQADGTRAFVASSERSQLLGFDLDRASVRDRIERVLVSSVDLRRDLQFAMLHQLTWDRLFFEEDLLENVFRVGPFVDHFLAVDHSCRRSSRVDADSVFDASIDVIREELRRLLEPGTGLEAGPLTIMGFDPAEESSLMELLESDEADLVEDLLETCADDDALLDFTENVFVHSAEHALSTWATDETSAGGSFELWYDVNFQGRDEDHARLGIYDSIQGGAGIADEVRAHLESEEVDLDTGLAKQSACHTAAADRTVIDLLAGANSDVLYDLFRDRSDGEPGTKDERTTERQLDSEDDNADAEDADDEDDAGRTPTGFEGRLVDARDDVIAGYEGTYNLEDLTSHIENRVRALFETRETARFYTYVAAEHETVESAIERTPRAVDLLCHLYGHVFRDPRVRDTYRRFANDEKGRDLSELGERLEELTMQCVTACPDCLETEGPNCVHGTTYQSALLSRRLLEEVCTDAA